jgi:predicted dehydrogenase
MSELKVGIIGCGGIGAVHVKSWAQVEGARIVAACDADCARAEATGATTYADYTAMLDGEQLDVVDICTPPNLHPAIAIETLKRGIPTICEKPLARTPEEARQITKAAASSGTLLMTAFCHRFHPPVEAVKAMIDAGTLGKILMFRNRFGTKFKGVESRWFADVEVAGGGTLMDTSVHSVDLFRYLVGEVSAASAAVATYNPAIQGLEDSGAMLLKAESGAIGVIEASWMTPWSANIVEFYGELGVAEINYNNGETRYILQGESDWTPVKVESGDRFVKELQHLAAVLRGTEQLRVTGEDGLRAVEVIHQAYAHPVG